MQPPFHDINFLPQEEGLLIFYISMSRISNVTQNAATCMDYIAHFNPRKIVKSSSKSKVGAVFIYTDFLYLYSQLPAHELKRKYMMLVEDHKNSVMKIVGKDAYLIHDAFSFTVWNQIYIDCYGKFGSYLDKAKNLYQNDEDFRKAIAEDFHNLQNTNLILDELQINFFLEEHVMVHLISMMQVPFQNQFIRGSEKWILNCYPGKPLKGHIYLSNSGIFNFADISNVYKNSWYDLSEKKLYHLDHMTGLSI